MITNGLIAIVQASPWARRRFSRKHSGLGRGVLLAMPLSAMLWAVILHALRVA